MGLKDTKIHTLIMNPQAITRAHIKELKERAGSWVRFAKKLGYKSKSTIISAYAHPERITPKLQNRIREYEMELEAEVGHYFDVTLVNGVKHVPKRFRITQKMELCKGHREYCTYIDKQGFCNDECRELFKAKQARKR